MIKQILLSLPTYPDRPPAETLEGAAFLAQFLGAGLTAQIPQLSSDPATWPTVITTYPLDVSTLMGETVVVSEKNAAEMTDILTQCCSRLKVTLDIRRSLAELYPSPDGLVDMARLHDLLVLPVPEISSFDRNYLEPAIFDTGRPTLMLPSGHQRTLHVRGEVVEMGEQGPRLLRGSAQDVTEQRLLQDRIVTAEAERRSSEREREIADELQRSLLPEVPASTCAIDVATYCRPGLAGTQVGGDWYDVIDLGGGRTALVIGDVMGHGVRAAAVMGQVKSAVRAFARLDLPPAELAEHMDGLVQDLPGDEIVTWVYAVYDPAEACVSYANAGHLPPLLIDPTGDVTELGVTRPPLGAGFYGSDEASTAELRTGSLLALYTDGLAERRGSDLADGLDSLTARLVAQRDTDLSELPGLLVDQMLEELGEGTDDLALALVRVQDPERQVARHDLPADPGVVGVARDAVAGHLGAWGVARSIVDDLVLVTSELVTNAVLHGSPPIELRLQRTQREIVVEVKDDSVAPPRRRRAGTDDEGGRGLSIVEAMTDRWGSRSVADGKVVWATMSLGADRGGPA